jgi:hypothetical protein
MDSFTDERPWADVTLNLPRCQGGFWIRPQTCLELHRCVLPREHRAVLVIAESACGAVSYTVNNSMWQTNYWEGTTSLQVKKLTPFYKTGISTATCTRAFHLSLSWARSMQTTSQTDFLELELNIIPRPRLGLPSGFFPSSLPNKTLYTPPHYPCYMHRPDILLYSVRKFQEPSHYSENVSQRSRVYWPVIWYSLCNIHKEEFCN